MKFLIYFIYFYIIIQLICPIFGIEYLDYTKTLMLMLTLNMLLIIDTGSKDR